MTDLVLHVGAHKTGTSVIQNTLRRRGDDLGRAGVVFASIHDRAWGELGISRLLRVSRDGVMPDGLVEALRTFIEETGAGATHHVVSAEDLLGRPLPVDAAGSPGPVLYATAALSARILAEAAAGRGRVVVYLRDQADLIESLYRQRVLRQEMPPFEEWMDWIPLDELSWRPVVGALADAFGPGSVTVKWFRLDDLGLERHVAEFLSDACGVDVDLGEPDLPPHASNPGLSDLGLELARRTIPLLVGDPVLPRYRRFLVATYSKLTHPRTPLLDSGTRHEIVERYRPENQALLSEFGTDLERSRGIS